MLDSIRDFIKSLPKSLLTFVDKKENYTYIAFRPDGGIGDMLRYKSILFEILKMSNNVVFDIYNKASHQMYKDIPNIRFFINYGALNLTKGNYDVVLMVRTENKNSIRINSQKSSLVKQLIKNINEYNKIVKIGAVHFLDYQKMIFGVGGLGDNILYLAERKCDLNKFGITDNTKFVTFQIGCGNEPGFNTKCWQADNWAKMLKLLKKYTEGKFKIIQIGKKSHRLPEADIDLLKKTSFDELVCIISRSRLHIDADCGCMHIAKAVNTKSIVLWGPTDMNVNGYKENINICSNICEPCYLLKNWDTKCQRNKDNICMDSIKPEFVAEKAIEYLKTLNNNP